MRSHGVTDFPDPQAVAGGGISIRLKAGQGSDLNPNSAQFQAAQRACQSIMGGPLGGGGHLSKSGGGAGQASGNS